MDLYSGYINKLIDELSGLPGIGSKSAQRLAFHLIGLPEAKVNRIANAMIQARQNVRYCKENIKESIMCCTGRFPRCWAWDPMISN